MRRDIERLKDILEAADNIGRYVQRGKDACLKDELTKTWLVHHLLIIGEAASRLSEDFRRRHQDALWPNIIAMRNILVHEYFGIDHEIVWRTASSEVPSLVSKIKSIMNASES